MKPSEQQFNLVSYFTTTPSRPPGDNKHTRRMSENETDTYIVFGLTVLVLITVAVAIILIYLKKKKKWKICVHNRIVDALGEELM